MSTVTFPMLNLKLKLSQVAVTIFGVDIYWYAIFIVSAICIGILICKKRDGLYDIKFEDIIDLFLILIPISIICARIYYVIFDYKDFIDNPIEVFNMRSGGLAVYGGIIGGAFTCIIYCKKKKIKILDLFDFIVPCLALRAGDR